MSSKRLWLGIAAVLTTQIILNSIASSLFTESLNQIALRSVLIALLSAFAGGFVARKGIVLPAIVIWLLLWTVTVYFLYMIAAPVDPAPFPSIFQHNWIAFLGSGVATIVGAKFGQALATQKTHHAAAT